MFTVKCINARNAKQLEEGRVYNVVAKLYKGFRLSADAGVVYEDRDAKKDRYILAPFQKSGSTEKFDGIHAFDASRFEVNCPE